MVGCNFEMKDLGEADVNLNIKLLREGNGGVTLVQSHYVEKVLSLFRYSDCCWYKLNAHKKIRYPQAHK
jgi:hypothetical protein